MDATFFPLPDPGYLEFKGPDRVGFINRQTTNDIFLLHPERSVTTVLTDPAARILDVLQLHTDGETIWTVTIPGRGSQTADFLKRRIFFNDNVTLTDLSEQTAIYDLDGPAASKLLAAIGLRTPPARESVARAEFERAPFISLGQHGLTGEGFRVIASASVKERLGQAFASAGGSLLTPQAYDQRRIEAGLPSVPELNEDYTPLETRLENAISHTKGCYTGQEIIARQITYDKITRKMVGLKLDSAVSAGNTVLVTGKKTGKVTSATISSAHGAIALAVLKKPNYETGTTITVEQNGKNISGKVVPLPFEA